jgi:hypothetical protein
MKVPKELAPNDVMWKELASLELFPYHSDRIRVAVDTSHCPIEQWVDSISVCEELNAAGRDVDMEIANAVADLLATRLSTYGLECFATAFKRVYDADEAERQLRILEQKK